MSLLIDRVDAHRVEREVVRESLRLQAAADPVTLEEFGYLLGQANGLSYKTKAGPTVGVNRALGISAWYSGVRWLSETVAGLPWHHYMRSADGRELRAPQAWLAHPDVDQTWYGLVEASMMAILHRGDAFMYKLRNASGQVVGLREIHPDRVTGGIAPDGSKRFMIDRDEVEYTTREVLHIPGLSYCGRMGLNPMRHFAETLGGIAAADDYSSRWFNASTHIGGIISVPGPANEVVTGAARAEWDQFHQGLKNAHLTGVLSNGATYERLSLNAEDAQMLQTRQWGVSEVSRMLRITPHKLYDLTHATFSNVEQLSIDSTGDSIRPWVIRFENAINNDADLMIAGHYLEASLEGLLRGDSIARATFYNLGVAGGWMMPSFPARLENLPAGPELEYYMRPLNMAVIRPGQPEPTATPAST